MINNHLHYLKLKDMMTYFKGKIRDFNIKESSEDNDPVSPMIVHDNISCWSAEQESVITSESMLQCPGQDDGFTRAEEKYFIFTTRKMSRDNTSNLVNKYEN